MTSLYVNVVLKTRKLIFYTGCFVGLIFISCIGSLLVPFLGSQKRQYVLTRYHFFVIWWSTFVCGVRYKIEGLDNIPRGPCIILSNHQSSWETFLLQTLFTPLCTVLKQELLQIPFVGWGAKMLEPIALDRSQPTKAYKQLISQGQERVTQNKSVLIFPEGTRVAKGESVKFNRGGAALAFRTQVPIIPVPHNAGLYWPLKETAPKTGAIIIRIGRPIYTKGMTKTELYDTSTDWITHNKDLLMAIDS